MITAKLIDFDSPTINGRIYTKKLLEDALEHWELHFKTKTMPIFKCPTATPKVEDIVGYAENFRFEDGYLMADVGFLEERIKDVAEQGEIINIRPNGSGKINPETGVVEDGYRMCGLCIQRKPVVGAVIKYEEERKNS